MAPKDNTTLEHTGLFVLDALLGIAACFMLYMFVDSRRLLKKIASLEERQETEKARYSREIENIQEQNRNLEEQLRAEQKKTRELTTRHSREIENKQEQYRNLEEQLGAEQKKTRELTTRCSGEIEDMQGQYSTLQEQFEAEQKKTRELTLRLSEVMSDKLQHNNPNIVDLNDENRPTKLAEQLSELYDNQWTDAFDQLEPDGRQEYVLLEVLMTIYKTCSDFSTTQMIQIREAFGLTDGHTLPDEIEFKILSHIKKTAFQWIPSIKEKAMASLCSLFQTDQWPSFLESENMEKYVNECTKLCWLMTVQSPPVVLMTDACRQDQTFNKDIFKAYTTSGQYVDFVVWPALLLHEGGSLLGKGVAQGKD